MPLIGWRGNLLRFAIDPLGYTCNVYQRHGTIAALIQGYPSAAVFAFGPTYNHMLLSTPSSSTLARSCNRRPTPRSRGSPPGYWQ